MIHNHDLSCLNRFPQLLDGGSIVGAFKDRRAGHKNIDSCQRQLF